MGSRCCQLLPLTPSIESTHSCADLDVELAHWVPVVHGVESRNFVHTHWRHFQYPRNLIHHADAAESVLALSQVEERHYGGLLVLRGVSGDNLLDEFLILWRELEGNFEVILGRVAVLQICQLGFQRKTQKRHTTLSEPLSFHDGRDTLKARH